MRKSQDHLCYGRRASIKIPVSLLGKMKYCEKEVDLETTGEGVGDPSLPDTDNDLMDVGASLHARVNRCSTTVDRTHGDHVKGVAISLVVIILLLLVILLLGGG